MLIWGGGFSFKSYNSRNIYSIKVYPQVFMKFTDQATKKSITNLMQLLNYAIFSCRLALTLK